MKIAVSDFSQTPSGRFPKDGPHCGEIFRNKILAPALKKLSDSEKLEVVIDNVEGYGSSFLDEAFGGIVREGIMDKEKLLNVLVISYQNKSFKVFKEKIISYIQNPYKFVRQGKKDG